MRILGEHGKQRDPKTGELVDYRTVPDFAAAMAEAQTRRAAAEAAIATKPVFTEKNGGELRQALFAGAATTRKAIQELRNNGFNTLEIDELIRKYSR